MAVTGSPPRVVDSDKIWACLITNINYMPGLLTLHHTLTRVLGSAYPLVALTSPSLPPAALAGLEARGIPHQPVPFLQPTASGSGGSGASGTPKTDSITDERFHDTWTKLAVFALTGYRRIVLLDADMLPRRPLDELLDETFLPLDDREAAETGTAATGSTRVFAATHACTCNPGRKPHYPASWTPANCGFTALHDDPARAQTSGGAPGPLGVLNSGLLVLTPSAELYRQIHAHMEAHGHAYIFPDQDVLAHTFPGRWQPLPYVYNALKAMRVRGVHDTIWRDEEVKNIHYIFAPKPWEEQQEHQKENHDKQKKTEGAGKATEMNALHGLWLEADLARKGWERERGITEDGF